MAASAPMIADRPMDSRWWHIFQDEQLDELEEAAANANQTVAVASAALSKARAAVGDRYAAGLPSLSTGGSTNVANSGLSGPGQSRVVDRAQSSLAVSWAPDLFGRVRRPTESAWASAQASTADLAAAQLAVQGQVAAGYLQIRSLDLLERLLVATVERYDRALAIAQRRFEEGVAPRTDVLQARLHLASARAELAGTERQRALSEHALAVLVGQPPADFHIAERADWSFPEVTVPRILPSQLLQRRPDIAGAERRAAAASAAVGAETAARFPLITLTEVEDQLLAIKQLDEERVLLAGAEADAEAAELAALHQYAAGVISFADVIVAQTATLSAKRDHIQTQADLASAKINLVLTIGGGWHFDASTPQSRQATGGRSAFRMRR